MTPNRNSIVLAAISFAAFSLPVFAQELANEGPVPTTALISAESKNNAPLNTAALKLEVDGHAASISSISPVRGDAAQVAILIDDGLRANFGLHVSELQHFIQSLPQGTQVLVGYMQNGTVRRATDFSTDHGAVANSVRIPMTMAGVAASPYFCLSDFVKHWPAQGPGARFVLMLTNGVDPYNGSTSPMNQDSPYVQTAQNDAQRAGVAVYSIYYGESGMRGRFAGFSGQSYLQQVAEATGGESFYNGTFTPPSIAPYLSEFRKAIGESYLVTFQANATREKRDTLVPIKLKTEQSGVKIHAPQAVHPGLAERAAE